MFTHEQRAALESFISSHDGKPLDHKRLLEADMVFAKALVARILQMTPEQFRTFQGIFVLLTPEMADVLKMIVPELAAAIDTGRAGAHEHSPAFH